MIIFERIIQDLKSDNQNYWKRKNIERIYNFIKEGLIKAPLNQERK